MFADIKLHCCRLANKLSLKVADLSALDGDYQRSIQNYEKVAKSSVSKWVPNSLCPLKEIIQLTSALKQFDEMERERLFFGTF